MGQYLLMLNYDFFGILLLKKQERYSVIRSNLVNAILNYLFKLFSKKMLGTAGLA